MSFWNLFIRDENYFRSITKSYYRNSIGVLLMYDITKRSTFEHLEEWLYEVKMHIEPQKAIYMIVGHKSDQVGVKIVIVIK